MECFATAAFLKESIPAFEKNNYLFGIWGCWGCVVQATGVQFGMLVVS